MSKYDNERHADIPPVGDVHQNEKKMPSFHYPDQNPPKK